MPVKNWRIQIFGYSGLVVMLLFASCQPAPDPTPSGESVPSRLPLTPSNAASTPAPFDPPVKAGDIVFAPKIESAKARAGAVIYQQQCKVCHRLTTETLVGPGLKNSTRKRSPAWIMNMLLYTPLMLAFDPEAKKQLEIYKVSMPDQKLSPEAARNLLEFMRQNDQ
jgi:Cytochrome c